MTDNVAEKFASPLLNDRLMISESA